MASMNNQSQEIRQKRINIGNYNRFNHLFLFRAWHAKESSTWVQIPDLSKLIRPLYQSKDLIFNPFLVHFAQGFGKVRTHW